MRRPMRYTLILLILCAVLAGCNLESSTAPTPTPFATPLPLGPAGNPVIYVTATPFGVPASGATGSTGVATIAVPTASNNAVEWIINQVLIPAWNFLYTIFLSSIGSLWEFAGLRGGLFAQVGCCIVPGLLVLAGAIRYIFFGRRIFR